MAATKSRRMPLGPNLRVKVTQENITLGERSHSGHCMISKGVEEAYPVAKHVASDLATIRFTDPEKGHRYVYLTPHMVQRALVNFDRGIHVEPFTFLLRHAHVTSAGISTVPKKAAAGTITKKRRGGSKPPPVPRKATLVSKSPTPRGVPVPRRVGGKRPPMLHMRRQFGLRSFDRYMDAQHTPEAVKE